MKKMFFSAVAFAVVAVSAVAVAPTTSEAVPAFARQTGAACLNCHFQAIPRLAAFGRNFRMGAYRDMGEQALIEDEHLSLPAVFNASFLMKARFSTGDTKQGVVKVAKGGLIGAGAGVGESIQVQFPDESAVLFGGRLGENAGLFNEWDVITGSMLGAKMAYVFDLDAGIVALSIGTTDALGAASIFNDPSNAISRNLRGIQTRAQAMRYTSQHNGATGVGVYGHLADTVYFAVGGLLGQNAGGTVVGNSGVDVSLSPYLRAAFTGEIAGFDTVIGAWYEDVAVANYKRAVGAQKNARKVIGLDLQVQGDLGGASLGFYAPIVISSKQKMAAGGTAAMTFNGAGGVAVVPINGEAKVTGYNPYVMVAFGPMGVKLGYDYAKLTVTNVIGSSKYTNFFGGAWYDVAQNLTLDLEVDSIKIKTTAVPDAKATATTLQIEYVY